ncbi:MAG: hypothetical protein ABID38_03205 [Candidatus Diapherotrites archaeon]
MPKPKKRTIPDKKRLRMLLDAEKKHPKHISLKKQSPLPILDRFLVKNLAPGKSAESEIRRILKFKRKARVFEICPGQAQALTELKLMFGDRIHTIAIDKEVPQAKATIDEFRKGEVLEFEFPKNCDLIFSLRSLGFVGSPEVIVEKAIKSLAPGGVAYLDFPIRSGWGASNFGFWDRKFLDEMVERRKYKGMAVKGKLFKDRRTALSGSPGNQKEIVIETPLTYQLRLSKPAKRK